MNLPKADAKKTLVLTFSVIAIMLLIGFISKYNKTTTTTTEGGAVVYDNKISKTDFYFDTVMSITLYDSSDEEAIDECYEIADKYEKLFSRTMEGSEVYKINNAKGAEVEVSDETLELIKAGIKYSELSNGNFDITCGRLSALWDISNNKGNVPDEESIKEALSTIGYENIVINGNMVSLKNPETMIDLGGIAKGYLADKLKAYLNEKGIKLGIINLGGNVITLGEKAGKYEMYNIGIQEPFNEVGSTITSVKVKDSSIVTSGPYMRYFEKDGKLYHHIFDLTTGYPAESDLNSITIISESSMEGDALSTIVYVLGKDKGKEYLDTLDGVYGIFIDKNNDISYSKQ